MPVVRHGKNESTRFHTFIANRISTIRDGSTTHQWRYVEVPANSADCALRGTTAKDFMTCQRWLMGPELPWKAEEDRPQDSSRLVTIPEGESEVKAVGRVFSASISKSVYPLGSCVAVTIP